VLLQLWPPLPEQLQKLVQQQVLLQLQYLELLLLQQQR
jgi:hypothetical protein